MPGCFLQGSLEEIERDRCGKGLPVDNGYPVAYRIWREIDSVLVLFHFDEGCFHLLGVPTFLPPKIPAKD